MNKDAISAVLKLFQGLSPTDRLIALAAEMGLMMGESHTPVLGFACGFGDPGDKESEVFFAAGLGRRGDALREVAQPVFEQIGSQPGMGLKMYTGGKLGEHEVLIDNLLSPR